MDDVRSKTLKIQHKNERKDCTERGSPSYSQDMQMPVVVINSAHYDELKKELEVLKKVENYRCLKAKAQYDDREYDEWADALRVGGQILDTRIVKNERD